MVYLEFEWDTRKAKSNEKKHGVSFEEGKSAFFDDQAIVYLDPDHSDEEDRFILLGTSYKLNQIVVCHCFREEDTKVRIISARKANRSEAKAYWEKHK
jgi:uncharacterized DUF497 family protein